jgi:hypothetical protein
MPRTSGWVATLLAAAALGATGTGQPPQPAQPPAAQPTPSAAPKADPAVAKLVADLGADDYKAREKAGRDLAALGDKALPAMRAALVQSDSPEVRQRLAVLVKKIDTERLVSPKRVTLSAKDKSVKDVFDEIAKQTGYRIDFQGGGRRPGGGGGLGEDKHAFEFDNTPFWVAVDKVAAAAGCTVQTDYDDDTVRVYGGNGANPYVSYAGPFRFMATNIYSNKSVQLSGLGGRNGPARHEHTNLNFQVQSEPKNPMLGVTQAEVLAAADDGGASLLMPRNPNDRSSYYENRGQRGHSMSGNLNLNRAGGGSATSIKTLKAKIGVILLSGTSPEIVVPDPTKVKGKSFAGRTVELDVASVTEDPNQKGYYLVDVTAKKLGVTDPDRDQDYNWSNYVWQKVELQDAAGNKYRSNGLNSLNQNGFSVQMTIPFGPTDPRTGKALKVGPPAKLVVNEWLTVTHEVTFEFKDIPLP